MLQHSELLLLFVIIALGLLLGRLKIRGVTVGVSGVLFAGLLLGAARGAQEPLHIAHILRDFGLVLFVYAVGLTSGPGFFEALRRRGLGLNVCVVLALTLGACLTLGLGWAFGLSGGITAGIYCGALTNTPALASLVEIAQGPDAAPTFGYSVAYPFGIIGSLLAFEILIRLRARAFRDGLSASKSLAKGELITANFEVTNPEVVGQPIGKLRVRDVTGLLISRLRHGSVPIVPSKYTIMHEGDVVTVVGQAHDVEGGREYFGSESSEQLETQRGTIDRRRILVSRRELVGLAIADLDLAGYDAQVTRLRRADVDMSPGPHLRLELGDQLRVVAPASRMKEVSAYFGDSIRDASDIDFIGIAVGIVLGLLLGAIPLPTPWGTLHLGSAGGPLVVALVLGRLGRSGPFVWLLPYQANRLLRELGLLLFLAAVGTTAGVQISSATGATGLTTLGLGVIVTLTTNGVLLALLSWWQGTSVIASLGVASGMQTQPATLAAAYERAEQSDEVYVSYAVVYPVAMVGKIMLAQVVFVLAHAWF